MSKRDLSLVVRAENTREIRKIPVPVHFSNEEIKKHFDESMVIVKAQFQIAEQLLQNDNKSGGKMVWRSQIVLAEGLLDFYLHEVSKYCMFQMFCGNWDKSEKYARFLVPMSKVEEALLASSSGEWFFEYLNQRFSRDVFLSVESMREQLNLIGIGFVPVMVKAFPQSKEELSKKTGENVVQRLFQRRNEIAHQNDRNHATAEQNDITKEFVETYIKNIECIVAGIDEIIKEKDVYSIMKTGGEDKWQNLNQR